MVKKVESLSELSEIIANTADVYIYFAKRKRGRPPKIDRGHVKSMLQLCKTLLDDIDDLLDQMLPDVQQITDLITVFDLLSSVKRRYSYRIEFFKKNIFDKEE